MNLSKILLEETLINISYRKYLSCLQRPGTLASLTENAYLPKEEPEIPLRGGGYADSSGPYGRAELRDLR
jgi:hypothetical protein